MTLNDAILALEHNPEYKDGCTRHINCTNVREVLTERYYLKAPTFVISDWFGGETVYSYRNGREL